MNPISQDKILSQSLYQTLYQNRLKKRIFLEFIFGVVLIYFGCKIYPASLSLGQLIYLSTPVVFLLYSIRGYRITAGFFVGGVLAYYFSPETSAFVPVITKIMTSIMATSKILFCAFLIRYLLDKFHMALVSMRNLKEIIVFFLLSLLIPQLVFLDFITGLGHSLGVLTFSPIFLVWDAYVPKVSPPNISKQAILYLSILWLIMGTAIYFYCHYIYSLDNLNNLNNLNELKIPMIILMIILSYLVLFLLLIKLSAKLSNRFFQVIGLSSISLALLFYAILYPEIIQTHKIYTVYIQISIIFICAFWLSLLAKLR